MIDPVLSVIIANYNYGHFLEAAIQSVLNQNVGRDVELIVCDAGSTDDSVNIIKKYANGLPEKTPICDCVNSNGLGSCDNLLSWWCSERDSGQSEAFNKGFRHARGKWLTWLNADEMYMPCALRTFIEFVQAHPNAQWVSGNMLSFDDQTRIIKHVSWGSHFQPPFLLKTHAPHVVFGPSSFFRKSLYEEMGPIDESLMYAMDVDYWARLTMAGIRQVRLNRIVWAFRVHNESKTAGNQGNGIKEARGAECKKWHAQNSYYYRYSFANPWYFLWLVCRFIDGSLLVKCWLHSKLVGRNIDALIEERGK